MVLVFDMDKLFQKYWFAFIAALFLLGALGDWPYSYYQLLRWVVCAAGAYSAYIAYNQGRTGWTGLFAIVAVLFNPIAPFYMERETWQTLDMVAAIPFAVFPFAKNKHA